MIDFITNLKRMTVVIILLFIAPIIYIYFSARPEPPRVVKGMLDLSEYKFTSNRTVALNGAWEFYWNQLLTPADFSGGAAIQKPKMTGYLAVPGYWWGRLNGMNLQKYGCATYRLIMKVRPSERAFGLKTDLIRMTSRLFVNGALLGGSGRPTAGAAHGSIPDNAPYISYFSPRGNRIEIILQVADYTYAAGGIVLPIKFGEQAAIQEAERNEFSLALIVATFLLSGGFYYVGIFLFGRRDRSLLYFGIFCFLLSIVKVTVGVKLLSQFVPGVSFGLMYDIRVLSLYLSVVMTALFLQCLMDGLLPDLFMKGVIVLFGSYAAAVLLLPYDIHVQGEALFYGLAIAAYMVFILLLNGLLQRGRHGNIGRPGLKVLILALWCYLMSFLITVLYMRFTFLNNRWLGDIGMILFLLLISYMLAVRFANAYATIEKMSRRLLEQDKLKDVFLSNTSHEFKTPLHGIINMVQAVLEDPAAGMTRPQRENLALAVSTAQRLATLVNDILDFQKINQNEINLRIGAVDVRSAATVVFEFFRHIAPSSRVQLINRIPDDLPPALADENRLRQVFYNLIGNAVKFTPIGEVSVTATVNKDMIQITVRDTGIGIPPPKHEDIFLSFEQVSATRADTYGGTGLGLTISRQLVERMGGHIWVAWSEVDLGTEIIFTLPIGFPDKTAAITDAIAPETPQFAAVQPETGLQTIKAGEFTILAVDDDLTNLRIMVNVFARENYDILTAPGGAEALRLIQENRKIDLVLLDVMMPGMTGYEVCRQLREEHSLFELPVLLVTVRSMAEDIAAGFEAGANDYIVKPFEATELRARVKTLLMLKKAVADSVRAEIAFLQSQIKPHFFYNVLNTIISFCYTDSVKAGNLLAEFSNYLRRSFDIRDMASFTTLEKELEIVRSYVVIEHARFGARLAVNYDIEPCLLSRQIPPLIIQPLVENAVRHGLMKREEGGHIQVTARAEGDGMIIEVTDDGVGMPPEVLEGLLQSQQGTAGVGLRNINGRLLKFYGTKLRIISKECQGTTVFLKIPGD